MLKTRIITAAFLLAGFLGGLFFLPDAGWAALCALVCAAAGWEWGGLAGWGAKAKIVHGMALGALSFVLAISAERDGFRLVIDDVILDWVAFALELLALAFWLFVAPFWLKYKWPLRTWSAVLVGCIVLLPLTLAFMTLRYLDPAFVLLAAAPVWIADIAAYFAGRAFGRKKLAPSISPGKTWAGAVGAAVGVTAYGLLLFIVARGDDIPFLAIALVPVFSLALTALSIEGDLFESLLKRQADVKDSSKLLPGHGGVLDRIDSLTSTLPVLPAMLWAFLFIAGKIHP